MDRADATGLGVAFAGHAALLAALALGFAVIKVPELRSDPIEVELVADVGLNTTAPVPSAEEPAPKLAEIEGPVEPAPLPAVQQPLAPTPQPQPQLQPQPRVAPPQPMPVPRPQPPRPAQKAIATPPQQKAARSTGRLDGLLNGISQRESESRSTTPPAKAVGAAVEAGLVAEMRRQLKPHWKAPTGADVEQLRTVLEIWLAPSGAVTRIEVQQTTGQTASNRPQVPLHQEQARRAVQLAAPFRLPSEYYEAWKHVTVTFDKRLSQ